MQTIDFSNNDIFNNELFRKYRDQLIGLQPIDGANHPGDVKKLIGMEFPAGMILLCFLACSGEKGHQVNHVLLEGTIGTAKTELAKNVSRVLAGKDAVEWCRRLEQVEYARISGTPDMRPQDIVGMDMPNESMSLKFSPGPILGNFMVFYADELNRMPSRTQAVLLEAMAEHQVTINTFDTEQKRSVPLPNFFMLASQNPLSDIGTEPLPEAQLDRFMVRLSTPLPRDMEKLLSKKTAGGNKKGQLATFDVNVLNDFLKDAKGAKILKATVDSIRLVFRELYEWNDDNIELFGELRGWLVSPDNILAQNPQPTFGNAPLKEAVIETLSNLRQRLETAWMQTNLEQCLIERRLLFHRFKSAVGQVTFDDRCAVFARALTFHLLNREHLGLLCPDAVIFPAKELTELAGRIKYGPSPRAAQALRDLSKAHAWARGAKEVDIKLDMLPLAPWVYGHRVRMKNRRESAQETIRSVADILSQDDVMQFFLDVKKAQTESTNLPADDSDRLQAVDIG